MSRGLLIDTCALIWIAQAEEEGHLGPVEDALDEAREEGAPLYVSPMSAWEVGMVASKNRLQMSMSPKAWLNRVMTSAGLQWCGLPIEVLLESSALPGEPHGDPADRIIVATAREYGLRLVTRDRRILDYAAKGHVMALEC